MKITTLTKHHHHRGPHTLGHASGDQVWFDDVKSLDKMQTKLPSMKLI